MNVDKCLLRYLVINAGNVRSTVSDDPLGCLYIYVKPGMYEKIIEVSNIDFVQEIYAQNGIQLKKHISHMDGKETEVLFITITDLSKLTDLQQDFVSDTAPTYSRHFTNSRATEIINTIEDRQYMAELQKQKDR
ncbi:MAG: hypothetical protein ACLRFJ_03500 [Alphaproteobacteria bacterium]